MILKKFSLFSKSLLVLHMPVFLFTICDLHQQTFKRYFLIVTPALENAKNKLWRDLRGVALAGGVHSGATEEPWRGSGLHSGGRGQHHRGVLH